MDQETLTHYICPFCGKGTILCYKKRVTTKWSEKFEHTYLGGCCAYYPHENKLVISAMGRLPLRQSLIPRNVGSGKIGREREKRRQEALNQQS